MNRVALRYLISTACAVIRVTEETLFDDEGACSKKTAAVYICGMGSRNIRTDYLLQ